MAGKRIVYLGGCWPTNIGNAFIDMGSMQSLRMAAPEASVHLISEIPRWLFRRKGRMDNALRLDRLIDCDTMVVSGVTCSDEFVEIIGPILRDAVGRGIRVLFNGAGQSDYNDAEVANFRKLLGQLDPVGFVTRDGKAFEAFKGDCDSVFDGIDCAFFLPEAHAPVPFVDGEYIVVNFDTCKEPPLELDLPVYRTNHSIFLDIPKSVAKQPNMLTSDLPADYINLYAHCSRTYSDRVHACIATLSYGNTAMLFSPTPRGGLFEKVGAGSIRDKPTALDMGRLATLKRRQVEFLASVLS